MSRLREPVIANCEKKFVLKSLENHCRLDGRAFDELRPFSIEFGKDWGCCCVSLGKTRVVAQVSCEVQVPKSSRPSEGLLNINLELNAMGAPNFESGRQSELSIQLNRLLEKTIKDSKAVDLESLCIKVNEKVWAFRIDVNVLNHEGNILDCASLATIAALGHFRRPDVTCDGEDIVIHTYAQRDPIPTVIHHYPVSITFSIFNNGEYILVDPSLLEENVAEAHISVALNAYKELCSLHLGGNALMTPEIIVQTTHKAAKHATNIINLIKKAIEDDNSKRIKRNEVGFHQSLLVDFSVNLSSLKEHLDVWDVKKPRERVGFDGMDVVTGGNPNNFEENTEFENLNGKNNVKSLGVNSAEIMEEDQQGSIWDVSSEEEEEEMEVMTMEKPKIDQIEISDDENSEEEQTVVINKQKTKRTSPKKK